MLTKTVHYSRPMTQAFFSGATHEDLKWTINYLIGLLEVPEQVVVDEPAVEEATHNYSARINKLLSIPKVAIPQSELEGDDRLQSILAR